MESIGFLLLAVLFLLFLVSLPFILIRIAFTFLETAINMAADRIVAAIQAGPVPKPAPEPRTFLGHYKPPVPPPLPSVEPEPGQASLIVPDDQLTAQDAERTKLRRRMNGW